jgi:hypothetical protein
MNNKQKLLVITSSLLVILAILAFVTLPKQRFQKVLSSKPTLSGKIIKNPDFKYSSEGWLSNEDAETSVFVKRDTIDWRSNGKYFIGPFQGREGIVLLHPVNKTKGRYVEQTVYLPPLSLFGKYYLVFGIQNAANYISPTDCSDNIFRIVIRDESNKKIETIFERVMNAEEGWKDFCVDISDFANKNITIRLESLAGGPCGDWKGEWGEVDYIDILTRC